MWLWGGAALALMVLGALALIAFRPTTVTVIPRSHVVLFDEAASFTAYPAAAAAPGTLSFTLETATFEDSQLVEASGVERIEEKASGNITVFNNHSSAPVRLLKNTRFQTPDGLVFKAPAEVVVPGKRGSTPGQITITVIAEAAGEKYNVGPVAKFTLPGLRSSSMYANVYASSATAMTGGFSGDRPAAAPGALEGAVAEIRSRLVERARESIKSKGEDSFAFFDLAQLSYESMPAVAEGETKVRVGEKLTMQLPVFPAAQFAHLVAESVSAGAESGTVVLKPLEAFAARLSTSSTVRAEAPFSFGLTGQAQLVWNVDAAELAAALAGRDESAFQTIVEGFDSIEEAHARIEPFWQRSFPNDPADIKIKVVEPQLPR